MKHGEHHGHGRHAHGHKHHGAQTFRRGRALEFLQRLDIKRATLVQQLSQPELQALQPIISGELKAVELIRNEFIELFDLHESELDRNSETPSDLNEDALESLAEDQDNP